MITGDAEALALLKQIAADLHALREIRDELRLLRAGKAGRGRQPQTSAANLLRLIAEFVGDRFFSARELAEHAALPASSELHAAIVGAVGVANPRRLGKYFRRIEGQELDGLHMKAIGNDRDGLIWRVASSRV